MTNARLLLPLMLSCAVLGAPCLAAPGQSQPSPIPEDAGERRGPLLIKKRTVEVAQEGGSKRVIGPIEGDIVKALLSGDGKKLAVFWEDSQGADGETGRMEIWSIGRDSHGRLGWAKGNFWPQGMAWRPQGDALAWVDWEREDIGDANGGITIRTGQVWTWDGGPKPLRLIKVPGRKLFNVAFTRDGRRMVVGCGDVRVRVYNYASGKLERTVATDATAAQYAAKMRSRRR